VRAALALLTVQEESGQRNFFYRARQAGQIIPALIAEKHVSGPTSGHCEGAPPIGLIVAWDHVGATAAIFEFPTTNAAGMRGTRGEGI